MDRPKRPFSVQKRATKKKTRNIFYVQFRRENGSYGTAQSSSQTSRAAAEAWAWAELKRTGGRMPARSGLTFETYAESWWRWERCLSPGSSRRRHHHHPGGDRLSACGHPGTLFQAIR
jgi:hypothetical protein